MRSLINKIDLLRLDLPNSNFDVFTVSETWLTNLTEDKLTTIEGYNFNRADRKVTRANGQIKAGGGLGIYTRVGLCIDCNKFKDCNISTHLLELHWSVISRPHTKSIPIGNVYRPPDSNLKDALTELDNILGEIVDIDKYEVLILGDFNADYTRNSPQVTAIKHFETTCGLKQMIVNPTRITKQKEKHY